MKEAAVQRRHNLYRDSIVLSNSDPSLHLLGENPSIDWAREYGGDQEEADSTGEDVAGTGEDAEGDAEVQGEESHKRRRMKQVVSMIQVEGSPVQPESCVEVPGINDIPEGEEEEEEEKDEEDEEKEEEKGGDEEESSDGKASSDQNETASPKASEKTPDQSDGYISKEEEAKPVKQGKEVPLKVETATESASAIEESVEGEDSKPMVEEQAPSIQMSEEALPPPPPSEEIPSEATDPENPPEVTSDFPPPPHDDSGFQSPSSEGTEVEEEEEKVAPQPAEEHSKESVGTAPESETKSSDSETREQ